jgi:hypothetical protein
MATVGTPNHNNRLLLASASFEPHHDRRAQRAGSSLQRPPTQDEPGTSRAKPVETPTLQNPTSRNLHIINQAHMGGVVSG